MPRKLTKERLRAISRTNNNTVRDQRADLEVWDELLDFAESNNLKPIDILSDIWETCGEDIQKKFDILNLRTPGTLKLN